MPTSKEPAQPDQLDLGVSIEATDASVPIEQPLKRVGRGTRIRGSADAAVQWTREKAAEALQRKKERQDNLILQEVLPMWSDERRGVPNPMIRGGLFGTGSAGKRAFIKGETVASLSNYIITYKGEELRQDDLSVWMALISMARRSRIGDMLFFTGYELITDLGWRMHSDTYARVKESISRLKANELRIEMKNRSAGYSGSLIREYAWDARDSDGNDKWMVRFESQIADLFQEDSVTFLEWDKRKEISSRASLTLWLHAYYMSHTEPLPITIAKLHELCKSQEVHLKTFKVRVRRSLERLVEIGQLQSYAIVGETVHVKKAPLRAGASLKEAVTKRLT